MSIPRFARRDDDELATLHFEGETEPVSYRIPPPPAALRVEEPRDALRRGATDRELEDDGSYQDQRAARAAVKRRLQRLGAKPFPEIDLPDAIEQLVDTGMDAESAERWIVHNTYI